MTDLDTACASLAALCRASGMLGVNLSICVDGRVHVEVFRDSIRSTIWNTSAHVDADIAHPGDPLPAPSQAVLTALDKLRKRP